MVSMIQMAMMSLSQGPMAAGPSDSQKGPSLTWALNKSKVRELLGPCLSLASCREKPVAAVRAAAKGTAHAFLALGGCCRGKIWVS